MDELDELNPVERTKLFDAPIPGQGLTQRPGSGSWERPPELVDLDAVADWFWDRFTSPKIFRDTMRVIDAGVPVDLVAANLVAQSTMSGKFTVDMAMLVTPIVVVQLKTLANLAGASVSVTNKDDAGVDPAPLAKIFAKQTNQENTIKELPKTKKPDISGLLAKPGAA